jgi:hypothetical protein
MSDIIAAADTTASTTLLHDAETALGTKSAGPASTSLGPFTVTYSASVSFTGGTVKLLPPDVIEISNLNIPYNLTFSFSLDINAFLPRICLPSVCFLGWCTPSICFDWPTPSIPVSFNDVVTVSNDFSLVASLSGSNWLVDVVERGIPNLQFGFGTAALLVAIDAAVTVIVSPIPFIGPFLAILVNAVIAAIGGAGVTGLLGAVLTPFVTGLTFNIYTQPKLFPVIPAGGPIDPAVNVTITALNAAVKVTDKNELVLSADIT